MVLQMGCLTALGFRQRFYAGRPFPTRLQRRPTEVIRKAVKGMLPKNKLASAQLGKLKVYAGPNHPHEAQAPRPFEMKG